jgi:hypothetical protein
VSIFDRLFRLLPKDSGQPSPIYQPRTASASAASTLVTASIENDSNFLWEVECFCGEADPAAAAQVNAQQIRVVYPGNKVFLVASSPPLSGIGVDVSNYLNWQGRIIVPPRATIEYLATFTSGAAVNAVSLSIWGARYAGGNVNF